jgi:hypothetical protein
LIFHPPEKLTPRVIKFEKLILWEQKIFLKNLYASFDTLCRQFQRIFSTLIRGSSTLLELKRSNRIETVQYLKTLFYKQAHS